MKLKSVLTNEFTVRYDPAEQSLLIYRQLNPPPDTVPIRHRTAMLQQMGKDEAAKFVGQTILMFVPELRVKLFGEEPLE